ncbi:zinc-binding dehydrogenase [Williamsia sp. SKLECPSW1]
MNPPTPHGVPATMTAVVTAGVGGYEQLVLTEVETPTPGESDVLVEVLAAGVNNTDVNTRTGWYGSGGWNAGTEFPLIQGADCCGRVVDAGAAADRSLIGTRVLVRPCMAAPAPARGRTRWLGSDLPGAFAQYVCVPQSEVFAVRSGWSDAELATLPCSYGTAENMIDRARVTSGQRVLVTGASGGVGSATVQLARRRGAEVVAVAGAEKHERLRALGVDTLMTRDDDPVSALGARSIDVVVDNVAGPDVARRLELLVPGGTYVTSGAIAGSDVHLDLAALYLNDLSILGTTAWAPHVFPDLIGYVENDEIRPLVAGRFALGEIATAQQLFLEKKHVGSFVLEP